MCDCVIICAVCIHVSRCSSISVSLLRGLVSDWISFHGELVSFDEYRITDFAMWFSVDLNRRPSYFD